MDFVGAITKEIFDVNWYWWIVIIGVDGYGRLAKEIAELNGYMLANFLDDNSPLAVGKIDEIEEIEDRYDGAIMAIGNPLIKEKIFRRLKKPVSVIHPTAVVSKTAQIDAGCVTEANAVIDSEVVVKVGSFFCAGAVVNHNSIVNEFCQIDCNSVVAMGAEVPKGHKVESCSVFRKIEMAKEQGNQSFF